MTFGTVLLGGIVKSLLHGLLLFTTLWILFLLNEACLYGHISWSLAKAHQQSSLRLSQFLTSMRGGRANQKASFRFNVQKQPVLESHDASLAKAVPCI